MLVLILASSARGQDGTNLVINEILYDPSNVGLDGDANGDGVFGVNDDEFVEILNTGTGNVDITGWELRLNASVFFTFPSTVVSGESAVVVFGGGTPTGVFGDAKVFAATAGWSGLLNGGGVVRLVDGVTTNAELDYVPFPDGPNESFTRDPDGTGTSFVLHSTVAPCQQLFSPGTQSSGEAFPGANLTNTPPCIEPVPDQLTQVGRVVRIPISTFDIEGNPVSLSVSNAPGMAALDGADLVYTGQLTDAATTFTITLYANDGTATSTATFDLYVVEGQFTGLAINEYLADPDAAGGIFVDSNNDGVEDVGDDEFIEIVNNTTCALDLAGFELHDEDALRHVFASRTVPAGGVMVVFGGGSLLSFTNPPAQIASSGGLGLNQVSADRIQLLSPLATRVDEISYPSADAAISATRNPDGYGDFTNHMNASAGSERASPGRMLTPGHFLTNQPPILVDISDKFIAVGNLLRIDVRAYEPADLDVVSLSVSNNPANSSFAPTNGAGTFDFTPDVGQASQTFNVLFVAEDVDGAETSVVPITVVLGSGGEDAWINEIHYDNDGSDVNEGVEVAGPAGTDLANYALWNYNGIDGSVVSSNELSNAIDDEDCGIGARWFPISGLQNDVDGIALVKDGITVVDFLSWEGTFAAIEGPAVGLLSTNIGVTESATTPIDYSLQLAGTGSQASAFFWTAERPHSRGDLNAGQLITGCDGGIRLEKTVYLGHDGGVSGPGSESVFETNGAEVTYFFEVTNTGSVDLASVTLSDPALAGFGPVNLGTLTNNQTITAFFETTLGGDLTNQASVVGTPPVGADVMDEDTAAVLESTPITTSQLKINEFYYNVVPQGGNQFVELINAGITTEYLDGLVLSDSAGSETEGIFQFPGVPGGTTFPVAPGGYVFIAVDAKDATAGADWECYAGGTDSDNLSVPNLVRVSGSSDLSLFPSQDNLVLANGADTVAPIDQSTIIDGVNYGSAHAEIAPLSAIALDCDPDVEAPAGLSLNRCPDGEDEDVSSASDCYPGALSPGAANGICVGLPALSIGDLSQVEGNSGSSFMNFEVTLSVPATNDVSVSYFTKDVTAEAGTDYVGLAKTNILVFPAGVMTQVAPVEVFGDTDSEPDEAFYVLLRVPTNATIADALGVGTIQDDEGAPAINVQKTVYLGHNFGSSCPGGELAQGSNGTLITYCFRVENTGGSDLDAVTLTDPDLPGFTPVNFGTMAPGEFDTTFYQTTISGSLTNTAIAEGTPSIGPPVMDADTAVVLNVVPSNPSLLLSKTVYLGQDGGASCPGVELVQATNGAAITYCFVVTNDGDQPLTDVTITDPGISGFAPINVGALATGQVASAFFQTTVAGDLVNTATATGTPPSGPDVTDDDTAQIDEIAPALTFAKTVYRGHDGGASCPGVELVQGTNLAPITYCFVVSNAGDVVLGDVTLTDTDISPPLFTNIGTLVVGGVVTQIAEVFIGGDLVNTARVVGTPPSGPGVMMEDTAEVDEIAPAIAIQKTVYEGHDGGASCPGTETVASSNGAPVTYCFEVSNTGDVDLDNATVVDNLVSPPIVLNLGALAVGEVTTQSVDRSLLGPLTNVATVTASPPVGPDVGATDTAEVIELLFPSIALQKTVYLGHDGGASCPGVDFLQGTNGADITYCFEVRNDGDTVLNNVLVSDTNIMPTVSIPLGIVNPGEVVTQFVERTLTGDLTNTAEASGEGPGPVVVSFTDTATVSLIGTNPPLCSVVDLGTLGGSESAALALNNATQVVGSANIGRGVPRAFMWEGGYMYNLGTLPGGGEEGLPLGSLSSGIGINELGQIVGTSSLTNRTFGTPNKHHGYLYENGAMIDLGTLGGFDSVCRDINELGHATGWAMRMSNIHPKAYIYKEGQMVDLDSLSGAIGFESEAFALNNLDQVVGFSHLYCAGGTSGNCFVPFFWQDDNGNGTNDVGEMINLGTLGGNSGVAKAINDAGQIVGSADTAGGIREAFLVTPSNGLWFVDNDTNTFNDLMVSLGGLGGSFAEGLGINESGIVVGTALNGSGVQHAFIYKDGVVTDLNDLISPECGWELKRAFGINESGDIVGDGIIQGETHAFLLTSDPVASGFDLFTRIYHMAQTPGTNSEWLTLRWMALPTNYTYTLEARDARLLDPWATAPPANLWPVDGYVISNLPAPGITGKWLRVRGNAAFE